MTPAQEKILADFAAKNKGWPKEALDFALWKVRWHLTALPHQREPEDNEYDTFLLLAGRGSYGAPKPCGAGAPPGEPGT